MHADRVEQIHADEALMKGSSTAARCPNACPEVHECDARLVDGGGQSGNRATALGATASPGSGMGLTRTVIADRAVAVTVPTLSLPTSSRS